MTVAYREAVAAAWSGAPVPQVELSIEIFPARTPEAEGRLWRNLELFAGA